jgi:hypothetical protein
MRQNKVDRQRQPAIWLRRRDDGRSTLSQLGGRPMLPPDIEWPRHGQASTPLHFLAQIDLSTLPPTPLHNAPEQPTLPKRGLLFFFADMVEEMLWGDNGGPFATTRVIFAKQAGPEREPPDDVPEILHAFGRRAGGFGTGMIEYPPMALEAHVIDTFDESADPDAAALVASIEKAIGPLPVFAGPESWDAIDAAKPREYIHELNDRRELNLSLHQMLGVATNIQGTGQSFRPPATSSCYRSTATRHFIRNSCSAIWARRSSGSSRPISRWGDSTRRGARPRATDVDVRRVVGSYPKPKSADNRSNVSFQGQS